MPVYIYQPDAIEKMLQVEGEEYRRFASKKEFSGMSFEAFLELWKKEFENNPRLRNESQFKISGKEPGDSVIYGYLGYNRYAVHNDGEIKFMDDFSVSPEYTEKARKAGFRIFEERE